MTRAEIDDYADAMEIELIFADGFDDCIVGIGRQFNRTFVVYDYDEVIHTLMHRDAMEADDAVEFFDYNIVGSYVGDATPCFLSRAA
jgi:hypothetical protein